MTLPEKEKLQHTWWTKHLFEARSYAGGTLRPKIKLHGNVKGVHTERLQRQRDGEEQRHQHIGSSILSSEIRIEIEGVASHP